MKKIAGIFFIVILFFLNVTNIVYAGFGITPPYVRNTSLTRNSVYEQQILLVRSNPTTDLKATISFDVPDINDWFQILPSKEFLLPKGETKVPMTVRVTVPKGADFKHYRGNIRIKTGSADNAVKSGAVNISLGAQVDVDLTVIDKEIKDFKIRKIGISDLNAGHKVAWLYFPGKIQFKMVLENTGNVPVSPSEVDFRIYDQTGRVLLEETKNLGSIEQVDPFQTKNITAYIPTRLPPGDYLVRFQIKNGDEVKREGEVNVNIFPYGTLQSAGFGFTGLSLPHKLSVVVPIVFMLTIIGLIVYNRYSKRRSSPKKRTRKR
jgi:hypothetical protein